MKYTGGTTTDHNTAAREEREQTASSREKREQPQPADTVQ
jgi:hypothetical protein